MSRVGERVQPGVISNSLNLEGIVSKRIDTPYRSGPFTSWHKIKCPNYARP